MDRIERALAGDPGLWPNPGRKPMSPTPRLSPLERVIRTLYQVILAVGAAIPAAVALLPVDAALATKAVGIAGATVLLVTAAWNGLEAAGVFATVRARMGGGERGEITLADLLVAVAVFVLVVLAVRLL